MTNLEKTAIKSCIDRLNELASLERASFGMDKKEDEHIKNMIRPYMSWFECVSSYLDDILELTEEKGTCKKMKLEEIIRLNY